MTERYPVAAGAEAWSQHGSGERASITLVLIHGITAHPGSLKPFATALAKHGFSIEVPRLPGHGTHWRDMLRTRYLDWKTEVLRCVDAQLERGQRVFLVGLSMGATIALDIACERAQQLQGVVTINAPILDRPGIMAKVAPLLEKAIPAVPSQLAGLVKNDVAKPGRTERAYGWLPARAANSFLRALPRIRAQLPHLKLPVLVAYSPQDHSVAPDNSIALISMLRNAAVTKLLLHRSYHLATLDWDADKLEEAVVGFAT